MSTPEQILERLRTYNDQELVDFARDLANRAVFESTHELRKIATDVYGEDHPTVGILQIISLSPFISVALSERLVACSPHIERIYEDN